MERLTGPQIGALADQLVDATKEGRVTDWVERMSEVVRLTSMQLYNINWSGSPRIVAINVVAEFNAHCIVNELESALAKYKEKI